VDPSKAASPSAKMPPSAATTQYPSPSGVAAVPTTGATRPWRVVPGTAVAAPNAVTASGPGVPDSACPATATAGDVGTTLTVAALLAGGEPPGPAGASAEARFDVITADADPASPAVPGDRDYARLAERAGRHYPLTMFDPGASEVTRVLGIADQLVLVAPASADAPRSLAMTQEWLNNNGQAELAARAVTVVNRVSKASMSDVEQTEAVARGRCRAIVRIPWDDGLAAEGARPGEPEGAAGVSSLRPPARHAYTALAGVLVAGLAAAPVPRKVLR